MNKQNILDNVENLTAEELFNCINQGIVTLKDLQETNNLDATKRKAILNLQNKRDTEDDKAWDIARYENEISLRNYISAYPAGRHVQEAKDTINELEKERRRKIALKQDILNKILHNPNSYSPNEIKEFLRNNTITKQDLVDCGILQSAIDNLENIKTIDLKLGDMPDKIPDGYTEVYFWGGTGSGKTCALGAILQMAEVKGYLKIVPGPGYLYATQLKNIFSDDDVANDYLPAPSPVETTQYLPFTLKRPNENFSRSVSLIELSGEIFKCFFYKNTNMPLPSQSHENTFNSLNKFLKSKNRKIHFFFIDYDRENQPDVNGLKQSDYLAAASTYFKENEVFGKTTDAIYVVLTKSDLLFDEQDNPVQVSQRVEYAKQYLQGNNYLSFINTLKDNCKKYSINAGKLTVEPFSLGKVYFKQICNFEGSAATNIVEILMNRIAGSQNSILDIFNK